MHERRPVDLAGPRADGSFVFEAATHTPATMSCCTVAHVADGPAVAHIEGHVVVER